MSGTVNPNLVAFAQLAHLFPGMMQQFAQAQPMQPAPQTPQQSDPNDFSSRYNTALSPAEEQQYQAWGRQQATGSNNGRNPALDTYDYDMRGFWKSGASFAGNGHAGDMYKKPNHPTFSSQSLYNGVDGYQGGAWGGGQNGQPWTFTPSPTNLQFRSPQELQQYFASPAEGGQSQLLLPQSGGQQ